MGTEKVDILHLRNELYCLIVEPTKWVSWVYEHPLIDSVEELDNEHIEKVKGFDAFDYFEYLESELSKIVFETNNQVQIDFLLKEVQEYTQHLYQEHFLKIKDKDYPDINNEVLAFINGHTDKVGNYLFLFMEKLNRIVSMPIALDKVVNQNPALTLEEIALFCHYKRIVIPRNSLPESILHLLEGRKGSGLYQKCNDLYKDLADSRYGTPLGNVHKKRLENVLKVLSDEGHTNAADAAKADLKSFKYV
jgi:hypothetical protein